MTIAFTQPGVTVNNGYNNGLSTTKTCLYLRRHCGTSALATTHLLLLRKPIRRPLGQYVKFNRNAMKMCDRLSSSSSHYNSFEVSMDWDTRKSGHDLSATEIDEVRLITERWIRDFVVSLNLCPFADGVLKRRSHRIHVSNARDEESVWNEVQSEIQFLLQQLNKGDNTDECKPETTLVIFPLFARDDFLRFHYVCEKMERSVTENEDMVDEVMLAFFHPRHSWADAKTDKDAINFDKRAPFPVVNILRAPQVDMYVEQGRTQNILDRNLETLTDLGNEDVNQRFAKLFHGRVTFS